MAGTSPPSLLTSVPVSDVTVGFTGQEEDDELSLVNMNGRIYDPATTRFLTPDPFVGTAASSQSLNRYSYVQNSPLKYVDPSGLSWYNPLTWGPGGGINGWLKGRASGSVGDDGTVSYPIGLSPGANVAASPTNMWGNTGPKPMLDGPSGRGTGNVDDQGGASVSDNSTAAGSTPTVQQGMSGYYEPDGTYVSTTGQAAVAAGSTGASDPDIMVFSSGDVSQEELDSAVKGAVDSVHNQQAAASSAYWAASGAQTDPTTGQPIVVADTFQVGVSVNISIGPININASVGLLA